MSLLYTSISSPRKTASGLAALILFGFMALMPANAQSFRSTPVTLSDGKALADYEKIYIADIEVSLEESTRVLGPRRGRDEVRPVSQRDQQEKAADLHKALTNRLKRSFDIVSEGGSGVMTIQITITDLRSSRPSYGDLAASTNLDSRSIYAGGAKATFVLKDSNTELATINADYTGSLNDGNPRVGIWSDTDRAFSRWARNLRKFIKKN